MVRKTAMLSLLLLACGAASAAPDGELFGIQYRLKTRITSGIAIRTEAADPNLVAKLSNPGQQTLCGTDQCASVDAARRLSAATGTFAGVNQDNGDHNYQQWDVVSATTRLVPELNLKYGNFRAFVSGVGYLDPVNLNFDETHDDDRFQPRRTERPAAYERSIARGFELRQAYVQGKFDVFDRQITVSYGRQVVPWGESLLVIYNSVNELNPLDGRAAGTSGYAISELLYPIAMATLQVPLLDNLNFEAVVPTEWQPVQAPPGGSFFSTSDAAGRYEAGSYYLALSEGAENEDPYRRDTPDPNGNGAISSSTRTITLLPEEYGHPGSGGEFGGRLSYVLDTDTNTVELGAYYLHYHSRYPYFSAIAAQRSCARDSANIAQAAVDCRGFKPVSGANPAGLEPIPLDTPQAFLDYPRDIDLIGTSFNTGLLGWGFSGEYVYRPNLPAQVHVTDVIYAAEQPALPRQDLVITPAVAGRPASIIPSSQNAIPSYLVAYRGLDVQPGDVIRGYERLHTHQVSLSGLRVFNENPFGADQVTVLVELGAMYLDNLPNKAVLPFIGSGENTHPSPGRDGSGTADGQGDARRANPHFLDDGETTRFSAGYRSLFKLQYINLFPNTTVEPSAVLFHDVYGYSPAPIENFKQGRIAASLGLTAKIGDFLETGVAYNLRTGGRKQNTESDRDFASFYVSLTL